MLESSYSGAGPCALLWLQFHRIGTIGYEMLHRIARTALRTACLAASFTVALAGAQTADTGNQGVRTLRPVTVSAKANSDPVEKSYRKMIRGMDLFEREKNLAPNASLRFKLLPRRRETDMNTIAMEVVGSTIDFSVDIAPDHTFSLPRDANAFSEDAQVIPNRKKQSMTWRTEIRTPGLPPDTRRLGDLRLECRVGMEAGLVSRGGGLFDRMAGAVFDSPAYCEKKIPLYLFFSERPLFGVTLAAGERREVLPLAMLYAAASDDPKLDNDLPDCDCEVLVDRTYFLPLGDRSWPDDTLVEFDYMEGG